MWAGRRPIQREHERAVVRDFLDWFNPRRGTRFSVVAEPKTPEAIIRSVRETRWVEVADVFLSISHARDLYSYATPGEVHQPAPPGPYMNPDDQFAERFVSVLSKKLGKKSYNPCRDEYGPGYLLVCCTHYPLFDGGTLRRMKEHWSRATDTIDLGCFREVFIAFRSLNRRHFRRWHV